jgi:hypothetical protein
MSINYKQLSRKHAKWNAPYWAELKVLANGGNILNRKMLEKLLPKSPGEEADVYKWRIDNAYFIPYLGSMLGYYASSIISDPLVMNTDDESQVMPEYYEEFQESVYRSGSFNITTNEHVRSVLEQAFLTQTEYTLIDFPELPDEDEPPTTKLEEEMLGMDQAYLCPVDASEVYNLREDEEGNLIWINIHSRVAYQEEISDEFLTNVETFTIYFSDHWERYTFKWLENARPPVDSDPPTEVKTGPHSFGRVPVVRLNLPDTLYFGDKIGSIAKKIFQKMNALDYSSDRSLFQFLVVKLQGQSGDNPNPIADDVDRAKNQILGAGRVMELAEKDTAEMLGGDAAPLEWTQNHIAFLRDEMARIINQTALSLSFNNKMMSRSMESKAFDRKAMEIILEHLGKICKDYMEEIFDMVAAGRGETELRFRASGMEDYAQLGIDEVADIQSKVSKLALPSPTFNTDYAFATIKQLMDGSPKERLDIMYKELEAGYAKSEVQADQKHEVEIGLNQEKDKEEK